MLSLRNRLASLCLQPFYNRATTHFFFLSLCLVLGRRMGREFFFVRSFKFYGVFCCYDRANLWLGMMPLEMVCLLCDFYYLG